MAKETHAGGRPPKYDTPEEMGKKIDEYFAQCVPEYMRNDDGVIETTVKGKPILININSPSLSGLALYLGYESRQSIYDNENNEKFSYIIKRARTKVEEWVYQHSMSGDISPAVGIFILKQFGYTDTQVIDMTHSDKLDMSKYTPKELKQLAELRRKGIK